jgi:hypothetical protein
MGCRFAEVEIALQRSVRALRLILERTSGVMKFCSATRRRSAVALGWRAARAIGLAAAALALMLVAGGAGTALAQDTSTGDASWERVDSVLVVPPVYRPGPAAPADACAEDCSSPYNPVRGGAPVVVIGSADNPANPSAGTADNPTDQSVAVGGRAADVSSLQERQAAAVDSRQSADSLDSPPGSAQVFDEQQAAAQGPGNYGLGPAPYVIVGVPVGPFHAPATSAAGAPPAAVPARSMPASPAWMPQPMQRVAPLPPIVPQILPRTMTALPAGGLSGGVVGGFRGGQMSGFSAGFGPR